MSYDTRSPPDNLSPELSRFRLPQCVAFPVKAVLPIRATTLTTPMSVTLIWANMHPGKEPLISILTQQITSIILQTH